MAPAALRRLRVTDFRDVSMTSFCAALTPPPEAPRAGGLCSAGRPSPVEQRQLGRVAPRLLAGLWEALPLARTLSSSLGPVPALTSESPGPSALLVQRTKSALTTSLPALWICGYVEVLELLKAALERILCDCRNRPRRAPREGRGSELQDI